jgi:hypothetical protein
MATPAKPLRVLVACEYNGTVRRAFDALGHDAWSCDLLPAEDGSNRHIIGDARDLLNDGWDLLMFAHPPCTRLCLSGLRWLHEPPTQLNRAHYSAAEAEAFEWMSPDERKQFMWAELEKGAKLFSDFWNAPIERVCVENPKMHRHAKERIANYEPPAQIVQPWWFGEPVFKGTGLYLRGLPPLTPTNPLTPPPPGTEEHRAWSKIHRASGWGRNAETRWKERSRFFKGIAAAMAAQWGGLAEGCELEAA